MKTDVLETAELESAKSNDPQFTTPEQAEVYLKLWDRKFIRIDPKTKQPHESSKEFFWEIVGMYPAYAGRGPKSQFRATCEVQKFHRNKTYKSSAGPESRGPDVVKYVAYHHEDEDGTLLDTGCAQYDVATFLTQFKEDTTL